MFEDYFSIDELRQLIPSAITAEAYDKVLDTIHFALHPVLNDKDKKYLKYRQERSGELREYYKNNIKEFVKCRDKEDCLTLFESIFNELGSEGTQLLEDFLDYQGNISSNLEAKLKDNKKETRRILRNVLSGVMRDSVHGESAKDAYYSMMKKLTGASFLMQCLSIYSIILREELGLIGDGSMNDPLMSISYTFLFIALGLAGVIGACAYYSKDSYVKRKLNRRLSVRLINYTSTC